ncbi:MAG: flagellar biosynthetic protein FliO [Planctomycetes bacterium]|nr:flagellar biosynthetic protein FliO [Planctomycetota bacterium]
MLKKKTLLTLVCLIGCVLGLGMLNRQSVAGASSEENARSADTQSAQATEPGAETGDSEEKSAASGDTQSGQEGSTLPDWLVGDSEKEGGSDGLAPDDEPDGSPLNRFIAAIIVVIVLGCAAYYFSRKFVPKFTAGSGKSISVVETVHLGQHKAVHLLAVGESRRLLISSTNTSINFLADVSETMEAQVEQDL